jgi:hypothetical protein
LAARNDKKPFRVGSSSPGRVKGTRELVVVRTPYIVAYRIRKDEILILRILHGARSGLRWTAAVERLKQVVSRIIPGDWGKVESGWLTWPLSSRIARFGGGGRIHQFL